MSYDIDVDDAGHVENDDMTRLMIALIILLLLFLMRMLLMIVWQNA